MAEIKAQVGYNQRDGKRCIVLFPKIDPEKHIPVLLPEDEAWRYTPDTAINYALGMDLIAERVCKQFSLGYPSPRRKAEIAMVIEDAIQDAIRMPAWEGPERTTEQAQREREAMADALKNAEVDSRAGTVKMAVNL